MIKVSFNLVKGLFKAQHIYSFHQLVLYENYLICIFMNINENLKMRTKPLEKPEPHGVIDIAFLTDIKCLNKATERQRLCYPNNKYIWLCEIAWF